MPTLAANVGDRDYRSAVQSLLNAQAVLITGAWFVVGRYAGDAYRQNRQSCGGNSGAAGYVKSGIRERDIMNRRAGVERSIRRSVVHIVALYAVVHDAKAATQHRDRK